MPASAFADKICVHELVTGLCKWRLFLQLCVYLVVLALLQKRGTTMRYLRSRELTLQLIKAGCLQEPRWMKALAGLMPVRASPEKGLSHAPDNTGRHRHEANESVSLRVLLRCLRQRLVERHPDWVGHIVVDLSATSRAERDFVEKFVHKQALLMLKQHLSEDEAYRRTLTLLESELPNLQTPTESDEHVQEGLVESDRAAPKIGQLIFLRPATRQPRKDPEDIFRASWLDAQRDRWIFDQLRRRATP
jgi:hypothetical protein